MTDESLQQAAERIGKKYGISRELLAGWAGSIEEMERLADVVSNEKRKAVEQAAKGKAGPAPTPRELQIVLQRANDDFAAGKITEAEFKEIVSSLEVRGEGSQNPDPLAKANEDFEAGLISYEELEAAQRQAKVAEGSRSADMSPVARVNADFAAGLITLTEFKTILDDLKASTRLAQREARQAEITEQIAQERRDNENG